MSLYKFQQGVEEVFNVPAAGSVLRWGIKMLLKGVLLVFYLLIGVVLSYTGGYGLEIDSSDTDFGWLEEKQCTARMPSACSCCMAMYGHKGCVDLKYLAGSTVDVSVKLDGHEIDSATVTAKDPDPPCFSFRGKRICVTMYEVHYTDRTFSGCIKAQVKAGFIHKSVDVGCFRLSSTSVSRLTFLFNSRSDIPREQLL